VHKIVGNGERLPLFTEPGFIGAVKARSEAIPMVREPTTNKMVPVVDLDELQRLVEGRQSLRSGGGLALLSNLGPMQLFLMFIAAVLLFSFLFGDNTSSSRSHSHSQASSNRR
jgi:hypothetical protein